MKKFLVSLAAIAFVAITVQAQEIPDRKRGEFKPVQKHKTFMKKELSDLNLTEEQKTKLKTMNEEFRKQMDELKKQDQITVKEYREKMETLRKNHRTEFQSLLTPEQKEQIKKDREALKIKNKERAQKRMEKMKQELNLTEEQSAKMDEMKKANMEKMKAIRENGSLTEEQKTEQVKEVMKKQKGDLKSILTEEQLSKWKETRKRHGKKGAN